MRFKDALTTFSGFLMVVLSAFDFPVLNLFGYLFGALLLVLSWNNLEKIGNWIYKFRR